jgi:hypothetical protein
LPLLVGNLGALIGDRIDAFTLPQRHDRDKNGRIVRVGRDVVDWRQRLPELVNRPPLPKAMPSVPGAISYRRCGAPVTGSTRSSVPQFQSPRAIHSPPAPIAAPWAWSGIVSTVAAWDAFSASPSDSRARVAAVKRKSRGYFWVKKLGIETVEALREHFDADPERRATADTHKANIERYGAPTWYEWSIKYWGTKWNACDAKVTDNGDGSVHFTFDTAWSFPFPIFRKLAADFPMLNFEGSAQEPNMEMFITFEARNGQFTWQDDDEALEAAAALYREEDESSAVTA